MIRTLQSRSFSPQLYRICQRCKSDYKATDLFSRGTALLKRGTDAASQRASEALKQSTELASQSLKRSTDASSQRASEALKQSTDLASQYTKRSTDTLKLKSQDMMQSSRSMAESTLKRSTESLQDTSRTVVESSKTMVESVASKSISLAQKALETSKTATVSALSKTGSVISQVIRQGTSRVVSAVTSPFHKAREQVSVAMQDIMGSRHKIINAIWWWSLAAIGVYGIATTLPREVIRAMTWSNNSEKLKDEPKKLVDEKPEDKNAVKWQLHVPSWLQLEGSEDSKK
jgi:hypothetical protein